MPTLATDLRNKLERVVIDARDAAEAGARAALKALAVHYHEPYPHMKVAQRALRNHLRARARQLGDRKLPKPDSKGKDHEIDHLAGECGYEHWHRMLFARFLAENGLLIEPQENMAISLAEAQELAKEDGMDVWVYASRCAERMLPQIFRPDDPLLHVPLATEHMLKLETLLASLPHTVFTASDALGWVYQFWQSKKKYEVNRSEVEIGADEISAVTQLFTEPYMVEFLLHNTLGAWWAGKKLAAMDATSAKTEDELRGKLALPGVNWEYLRFVRDTEGEGGPWRSAAGAFDGWPKTAAELKLLDPCCGSGHFLVASLHHLVPIRMAEEGLTAAQAVDAVLRDNLHGLEIDERCCQIAAFALAFAAWKFRDAGGYRPLPEMHIACTGIAPQASKEQWLRLGEEVAAKSGMPAKRDLFGAEDSLLSAPIKRTLEALHELFTQAPILGSLINPASLDADLFHADFKTVGPLLSAVLAAQSTTDETRERVIVAAGMVKAAAMLADKYTIVITNVPYLGRAKQATYLQDWAENQHCDSRADLATMFLSRSLWWLPCAGTVAVVTPQDWLFKVGYDKLRPRLLRECEWNAVAWLGEHAFESAAAAGAFAAMAILSRRAPGSESQFFAVDASAPRGQRPIYADEKKTILLGARLDRQKLLSQAAQLLNPDAAIKFTNALAASYVRDFANSIQGLTTGDDPRLKRQFWEIFAPSRGSTTWRLLQGPCHGKGVFSGREDVVDARITTGELRTGALRGREAWGRGGIAIDRVSGLSVSIYDGDFFHSLVPVIVPHQEKHSAAILAFATSVEFQSAARGTNQSLSIDNGYFGKMPFDLAKWRKVAAEKYPKGLPEPESDDPTQWLFHGRPDGSTAPLQVGVVRLLGYRWPAELDDTMCLSNRARALVKRCSELAKFVADGIVCIPSVRGEDPAADHLEALLGAAGINPTKIRELASGADLDDWLRTSFFEEHCKLFHDRPFVWHVWDGRKRDGFHALLNYHKLCEGKGKGRKLLESLTYSYLGEWITRQKDGVKRGEGGAEDRLAAAVELQNRLKMILEGEPPFDIFVRWKPLAEQPIGWEPDINDGVRVNIRPFLSSDLPTGRAGAGVLRWKPNIKWTKDRGKEPERPKAEYPWFWNWDETTEDFMGAGKEPDGSRHNHSHYTNAPKQAARDAMKKGNR